MVVGGWVSGSGWVVGQGASGGAGGREGAANGKLLVGGGGLML